MDRERAHRFAWIALFFSVLAIIIFRAPEMVFAPSLLFDEGAKVFAHFYEHREPAQILRFKSGYLPLLGNLIGYAAVRFPTPLIPYALVGSAILISSLTYCLFFARSFRRWMPSDLERAFICLLFALAPISDAFLVTVSDYSNWNLLAALLFLTACRPGQQTRWRYLHGLGCNLLVWAHPLSILIAPLVIWRALKDPENEGFHRLLLFNLVVHQIFGVSGIITTHGLWDHNTGIQIDISLATKLLDSCRWTIQIIAATVFRTAFGEPQLQRTLGTYPALLFIWTVCVALASGVVAWRVVRVRWLLLFLGYLIVSVTFLSCFLRYEDVHNNPLGFINYSPRYIYLQSLGCLLLFGTLLSCAWEFAANRFSALPVGPRWRRFAILPWLALLCYYYLLNLQWGYSFVGKTQPIGRYQDPDPRNGAIVRNFFANLAEAEQAQGSHRQIQLTAAKFNDWPITIDTTLSHPRMKLRMSRRARVLTVMLGLIALGYLTRRWWWRWFSSKAGQQGRPRSR
jgi:hypothetical protein